MRHTEIKTYDVAKLLFSCVLFFEFRYIYLIVHFPISSFVRKVFKFIPIMSSDQNKQEMHNHFPVTWIQYRRSQYYRSTSLYKYVVVKLFQRHFKSRRNERQETPSRWNRFENTESFPEILYKRKCIGSRSWTEFTFSLVMQRSAERTLKK